MAVDRQPAPTLWIRAPALIWLARSSWLLVVLMTAGSLTYWALLGFASLPVSLGGGAGAILGCMVSSMAYATTGLLLVERRPSNVFGWLFLACAVAFGMIEPANLLVASAHTVLRPIPQAILLVAWLVSTVQLPAYATLVTAILLTFPSGTPIGPRWWSALALTAVAALLLVVAIGVDPTGLIWYPSLANPFAVSGVAGLLSAMRDIGMLLLTVGFVAAVASLVLRYRRGDLTLRRQLRWIGVAGVATATVTALTVFGRYTSVLGPQAGSVLMLAANGIQSAIPIAAGIAIFRHHLFDIDVLIDRSLVYLPLMGLLGGLYAASVTLVQRVFVALTGDTSDIAIVVSSLLIAWVFTPLRHWLEGIVEGRVGSSKAGSKEALTNEVARAVPAQGAAFAPAAVDPSPSITALEEEIRLLESRLGWLEEALKPEVEDPPSP